MRNKSLDNLQQVCLTDTVDFTFASPEEPCAELLAKARGAYVSRLKRCSSSWPTGSLDTACAYPVLITQSHHEELYELHQALNLAIEDIIARWWKDEQAQFPQRMPLKPDEEDLLRVSHYIFPLPIVLYDADQKVD